MVHHSVKRSKALILIPLLLTLFFIIACGAAPAEPVVVEKQIIVEKEVIKEVHIIMNPASEHLDSANQRREESRRRCRSTYARKIQGPLQRRFI